LQRVDQEVDELARGRDGTLAPKEPEVHPAGPRAAVQLPGDGVADVAGGNSPKGGVGADIVAGDTDAVVEGACVGGTGVEAIGVEETGVE
jgi:hypothetical protein